MSQSTSSVPAVYPSNPRRLRLVFRDVTPDRFEIVGAEIDLAALAAWQPGQTASVFTDGFRVVHACSPDELARRVHPTLRTDHFLLGEERELIQKETERILLEPLRALGPEVPNHHLDALHLCAETGRWWTTPVTSRVRHIVAAAREPAAASIGLLRNACTQPAPTFSGVGYCLRGQLQALNPFTGTGMPGSEVDLEQIRNVSWGRPTASDREYWKLAHASMSARQFVRTFARQDEELAEAMVTLITYQIGPGALQRPIAHTRVMLEPREWLRVWMHRGEPFDRVQIDLMADSLRELLSKAGLRPWSQCPPPLLPPNQSLREIVPILTDEMIDQDAVNDLAALGIHTLEDLRTASPETLRGFSMLRGDLFRASETVRAFGYTMALDVTASGNRLKLKRTISYRTEDDKSFATRLEAEAHEITLRRRQRLQAILTSGPGPAARLTPEVRDAVLDSMVENWEAVVALSDRSVRRELRNEARKGRRR